MDVDYVAQEVFLVLVCNLWGKFLEFLLHTVTLDLAVEGLVDLSVQVGHVLDCHIGVCVGLGGGGGVCVGLGVCVHIVHPFLNET